MENKFARYLELAKKYNIINAQIIAPDDIIFDIRAILKCRWGCNDYHKNDIRCDTRGTTLDERMEMIKKYSTIILLHSHEGRDVSIAALNIERQAFLDGYYFASALKFCNYCANCSVDLTGTCQFPDKVRPCDQSFGINIFATVQRLGLPCGVLTGKDAVPNRYGFVFID